MNEHEYALMRRVEDSYWWYAILRESVAAEVKSHLAGRAAPRILDAGCGTGGMMAMLRREDLSWQVTGIDFSPEALEHTRERGFPDVILGSVNALPFPNDSFDVVISLDVLYFEGVNDREALSEFHRVLKPGGLLVLNLPAFDLLRGEHDVAVRGVRRYTPFRVRRMLSQCNLEAMRVHCWNLWLFLPILCWRGISRMRHRSAPAQASSDLFMPPAFVNSVLTVLGRIDTAFCRAIRSPLGTSVHALARKPQP